ncbi:hypothetical protein B5F11_07055, partial [Anaerotruncus colihominis]
MPLRGLGCIGHWGGSGPRPRIAPAIKRIITAMRLWSHTAARPWLHWPLGRQRAAPAYRPGHKADNNRYAVMEP